MVNSERLLCVVGLASRAGSRAHATSITDRVKTLRIASNQNGIQDIVVATHRRTRQKDSSVFRNHDFVTLEGRLYDSSRSS
jgi:hypothetical protein